MANFTLEIQNDNTNEVIREMERKVAKALEAVGIQCSSHAKQNITAATRIATGTMRNTINHVVRTDEGAVYVGTNTRYAIYHEYGTGIYADGGGGRKTPWVYKDAKGEYHRTRGIKPIHFLKNAVQDHANEYKQIIEKHLK